MLESRSSSCKPFLASSPLPPIPSLPVPSTPLICGSTLSLILGLNCVPRALAPPRVLRPLPPSPPRVPLSSPAHSSKTLLQSPPSPYFSRPLPRLRHTPQQQTRPPSRDSPPRPDLNLYAVPSSAQKTPFTGQAQPQALAPGLASPGKEGDPALTSSSEPAAGPYHLCAAPAEPRPAPRPRETTSCSQPWARAPRQPRGPAPHVDLGRRSDPGRSLTLAPSYSVGRGGRPPFLFKATPDPYIPSRIPAPVTATCTSQYATASVAHCRTPGLCFQKCVRGTAGILPAGSEWRVPLPLLGTGREKSVTSVGRQQEAGSTHFFLVPALTPALVLTHFSGVILIVKLGGWTLIPLGLNLLPQNPMAANEDYYLIGIF